MWRLSWLVHGLANSAGKRGKRRLGRYELTQKVNRFFRFLGMHPVTGSLN